MKVAVFAFLSLLATSVAFADFDSSIRAGWSCDVKTGPAGTQLVAHLNLYPSQSIFPKQTDQRVDGDNYVRFEVSSLSGAEGQYYSSLIVSVMRRHRMGSDERVVTTTTRYNGPAVDTIDSFSPSNLFLVVNPANAQIECKPEFRF